MKLEERYQRTELGKIHVMSNPPVQTEDLMIAKVHDTFKGGTKLDIRIYLKTDIGSKPFEGFTQQGFRLTLKQYKELKALIPVIDEAFKDVEEEE